MKNGQTKKKLFILDECIFQDVKKRYKNGAFALVSESLFLRSLLEDVQNKLNRR